MCILITRQNDWRAKYKMYEIKEQIDSEDGIRTLVFGDLIESTYGVDCLICGKFIPCSMTEFHAKICNECKQAVLWAKEKMRKKDKKRTKINQLPGQLDVFDITNKQTK